MHPEFDDKLLRADPENFFGLSAGWDKASLKRGYAKLIRQWKPERFPEEFKAIRAAFELLMEGGPATESRRAASDPEQDIPDAPPKSHDLRAASAILEAESREKALEILTERGVRGIPDALALARLRAGEEAWPGYDLHTLADALKSTARSKVNHAPLVAIIESILSESARMAPEDVLARFEPFESTPFYFDITTDLWISFSKTSPDRCLMRLDRLIYFGEAGRSPRTVLFLLKFCISGAMRLPQTWLERRCELISGLPGIEVMPTPPEGRLASHDPLRPTVRIAQSELDLLESLLAMRKRIAETENKRPALAYVRTLMSAYCDGDVERCLPAWKIVGGRIFDGALHGNEAWTVMTRIRESLDPLVAKPEAPPVPVRFLPELMLLNILGWWMGLAFVVIAGGLTVTLMFYMMSGVGIVEAWPGNHGTGLFCAVALAAIIRDYRKRRRIEGLFVFLAVILVWSAKQGRMNLRKIREFVAPNVSLRAVFLDGTSQTLRATVFQGARTSGLLEAYGLVKGGDPALRPRLLRRRSEAKAASRS